MRIMPLLQKNNILAEPNLDSLTLTGDKILVRVLKQSRFHGRFFLPKVDDAKRDVPIAKVELVGDRWTGADLPKGTYVLIASWTGREFPCPDEDLILLEPDQIEAVIEL